MQKPVKIGKYTEINKQSDVKFWLLSQKLNIELPHIHLAVLEHNFSIKNPLLTFLLCILL